MLRAALLAAAITLPMLVSAAELHEGKFWRNCEDDRDCIAIQGTCDLTAVNMEAKEVAAAYYKQEAARTNCAQRFWKPKSELVRCRLNQCETIPKQAAVKK